MPATKANLEYFRASNVFGLDLVDYNFHPDHCYYFIYFTPSSGLCLFTQDSKAYLSTDGSSEDSNFVDLRVKHLCLPRSELSSDCSD